MKKRILCLVLVVTMLLPIQAFAVDVVGDKEMNSLSSTIIATKSVTHVERIYVGNPIPTTYDYGPDRDGFSGTLYLSSNTRNGNVYVCIYYGTAYKYIN